MSLTPKNVSPEFAIRLQDDCVAKTGDWLLVFAGRVRVMTHDEVTDRYELEPQVKPQPEIKHRTWTSGTQNMRVLAALKRCGGHDCRSAELRSYLDAADQAQVSCKLWIALQSGYASRTVPPRTLKGGGYLWSLTPAGWELLSNN